MENKIIDFSNNDINVKNCHNNPCIDENTLEMKKLLENIACYQINFKLAAIDDNGNIVKRVAAVDNDGNIVKRNKK